MRAIQIVVIAVLVVATLFAIQNLEIVTVSFLNFGISAPLALVAAILNMLGMITGGATGHCCAGRWRARGPNSKAC